MATQTDKQAESNTAISRIIVGALSLAYAALLASLEALRSKPTGFSFDVSWATLVAFCMGAALAVPAFQIIFGSRRRRLRLAALVLMVAIGLASFLYPLRFVPGDNLPAVLFGMFAGVCTVSLVGVFLSLVRKALDEDTRRTEDYEGSAGAGTIRTGGR